MLLPLIFIFNVFQTFSVESFVTYRWKDWRLRWPYDNGTSPCWNNHEAKNETSVPLKFSEVNLLILIIFSKKHFGKFAITVRHARATECNSFSPHSKYSNIISQSNLLSIINTRLSACIYGFIYSWLDHSDRC